MTKRLILSLSMLCFSVSANAASNILSWTDNSSNETGFEVWRKSEACAGTLPFALLITTTVNITTFTDGTVAEGTTYCYEVRAVNSTTNQQSAFSNMVARTVPFSVLNAPSGLGVVGGP